MNRLPLILFSILLSSAPAAPAYGHVAGGVKTFCTVSLFFGVTLVAAAVAGLVKSRIVSSDAGAIRRAGARVFLRTLLLETILLAVVSAMALLLTSSATAAVVGMARGQSTSIGLLFTRLRQCGLLGPFLALVALLPVYFYPVFRWNLQLVRAATGPRFGSLQRERKKAAGLSLFTPLLLVSVMAVYAGLP